MSKCLQADIFCFKVTHSVKRTKCLSGCADFSAGAIRRHGRPALCLNHAWPALLRVTVELNLTFVLSSWSSTSQSTQPAWCWYTVAALVHWVCCCDQEGLLPLQTGVLSSSPQSQICLPDSFGVAAENKKTKSSSPALCLQGCLLAQLTVEGDGGRNSFIFFFLWVAEETSL